MNLHIGFDDTDSPNGGCTTYLAALLVEKFSQMGVHFIDYPNIIRLNPNISYKTRGNAALALRLQFPKSKFEAVREVTLRAVEKNSQFGQKGTDPAVVLLPDPRPHILSLFSRKALTDTVPISQAVRTLARTNGSAITYGDSVGLIGALAAAGHSLYGDHTYELIAYRIRENLGKPRLVEESSVIKMDRATQPTTFNNYDSENKRVLVTPHGPDPVLFGIRGETAHAVRKGFTMIQTREPIERWVIFRTNHGTDAHLKNVNSKLPVRPDRSVRLRGVVKAMPRRIAGGHVFIQLLVSRQTVNCAAFEPTGRFKEVVASLIPGDELTACGGVKQRNGTLLTVNLEKIIIHRLAKSYLTRNPECPSCGKRLKSSGRRQRYRCARCHHTAPRTAKQTTIVDRKIRLGLNLPDLKAHRHLTKPLSRYGREKKGWDGNVPTGIWHVP